MKYFAFIFFLLLLGGCDLFQTRDAQQPNQSRSNYQVATSPEIVIQNLINSMKENNLQNYLACFSDTSISGKPFLFIPSSGAASLYPSFASPWDKKNEEYYFKTLISRQISDSIRLVITNPISSQVGDSLIYSASYTLSIPFIDASVPSMYEGDLKFSMINSRLVWSIYLWQDIKSTSFPSWSELKGRLY